MRAEGHDQVREHGVEMSRKTQPLTDGGYEVDVLECCDGVVLDVVQVCEPL